jgi:hypothetical protein
MQPGGCIHISSATLPRIRQPFPVVPPFIPNGFRGGGTAPVGVDGPKCSSQLLFAHTPGLFLFLFRVEPMTPAGSSQAPHGLLRQTVPRCGPDLTETKWWETETLMSRPRPRWQARVPEGSNSPSPLKVRALVSEFCNKICGLIIRNRGH